MLMLGKKVLTGSCGLTPTHMLAAVKKPWEVAFSQEQCMQAWASIGVSPFNEKVYWDLKAVAVLNVDSVAEMVATLNMVKSKTEEAKLASCRAAKAARVQEKQVKMAASLELRQLVVTSLTHDAQILM